MNPTATVRTESAVHLEDGRERGWFWIENDVLSLPISSTAKLLYVTLARHANGEGASYPKIATLVEETGIGRTKIKEARAELDELVARQDRRGGLR